MLGAFAKGLALSPLVLVVLALLGMKPSGTIVGVISAILVVWALSLGKHAEAAVEPESSRVTANATLTSTALPVRVLTRENLASDGRWRRAFTNWRYGPPNGK